MDCSFVFLLEMIVNYISWFRQLKSGCSIKCAVFLSLLNMLTNHIWVDSPNSPQDINKIVIYSCICFDVQHSPYPPDHRPALNVHAHSLVTKGKGSLKIIPWKKEYLSICVSLKDDLTARTKKGLDLRLVDCFFERLHLSREFLKSNARDARSLGKKAVHAQKDGLFMLLWIFN